MQENNEFVFNAKAFQIEKRTSKGGNARYVWHTDLIDGSTLWGFNPDLIGAILDSGKAATLRPDVA